eukprot:CAMPEP_0171004758 /NCGR_PEP_ID=MMETSP0736-20130129/17927_1 /TAXON_ID=186038 /ORGANISM="Fragilariopsis kerguelensis, Strain L26-C5" /LENGTH=220 /DNA_ID=CAMNT_0011434263 /DNA_START=244 /DNA_END=907 /DNA_ORIENTATION=-
MTMTMTMTMTRTMTMTMTMTMTRKTATTNHCILSSRIAFNLVPYGGSTNKLCITHMAIVRTGKNRQKRTLSLATITTATCSAVAAITTTEIVVLNAALDVIQGKADKNSVTRHQAEDHDEEAAAATTAASIVTEKKAEEVATTVVGVDVDIDIDDRNNCDNINKSNNDDGDHNKNDDNDNNGVDSDCDSESESEFKIIRNPDNGHLQYMKSFLLQPTITM